MTVVLVRSERSATVSWGTVLVAETTVLVAVGSVLEAVGTVLEATESSAGSSRAGGEWSGSFGEGNSKDAGRILWERAGSYCLRGAGSVGRQRWVVGKGRHGLGWYFEG
jgi:hypothetical protein